MQRSLSTFVRQARATIRRKRDRGPVADTTEGPVRGKLLDDGRIAYFGGIPYAAPPVGDLRWRAPMSPPARTEELDASRPGPMAYQRAQNMEAFIESLAAGLGLSAARQRALLTAVKAAPKNENEDCLTLNIRAPHLGTGLPVMVWIHGGDHTDGSSSDVFYNSNALPGRGCVLVTINYRLGLMGFLAHPELADESAEGVSGNYGLLDQIAALRWLRENIEHFGGDPDQITIFGESAGGEAVLNLMTSPRSRGLFDAAIAQSPSDSGRWLHLRHTALDLDPAEDAGRRFAESIVGTEPGQISRLRALDPATLYEHYRLDLDAGRYFFPAVDGVVLPTSPMTAFSHGTQAPVPLMIGYNADEGSLLAPFMHPAGAEFGARDDQPLDPAAIRATFEKSYGSAERVDRLMAAYPGLASLDEAAITEHAGDHMFGVHVDHASRRHAAAGHPVFRYHFRSVPALPGQTAGAYHAAEVFHVFDTSFPLVPDAPDAHLLTREMGDRWFAFAASHRPDTPGRAPWPAYDPAAGPQHMVFDRPVSAVQPCPAQPGLDVMGERIAYLDGLFGDSDVTIDLSRSGSGTEPAITNR